MGVYKHAAVEQARGSRSGDRSNSTGLLGEALRPGELAVSNRPSAGTSRPGSVSSRLQVGGVSGQSGAPIGDTNRAMAAEGDGEDAGVEAIGEMPTAAGLGAGRGSMERGGLPDPGPGL